MRRITLVISVTLALMTAGGLAFLCHPRLACDEPSATRFNIPVAKDQTRFEHVYTLRNRSLRTIRLDGVKTSCNCQSVKAPDPVIPPFSSREVTARFDVARSAAGVRNADFLVFANGRREPALRLRMAYSFELGVWAYPGRIELGRVVNGKPVEFEVWVRQAKTGERGDFSREGAKTRRESAGDAAGGRIRIAGVEGKGMEFEVREAREEGELAEQKITGRFVNRESAGYHERTAVIKTDHPEYPELAVPVRWESVAEWSFTPSALHFGFMAAGDRAARTITLVSETGRLDVREAEVSGDGFRLASRAQAAPDKVAFVVEAAADAAKGLRQGRLTARLEGGGEARAALVFAAE
ncbi:MAG: DUF1573 domain-containing protein [Deltaproteobacteria bacterium]|jgi:hypothetical protein|nr:DUF1573 domain-containing protein [Deltaproteobacteria bacterium]